MPVHIPRNVHVEYRSAPRCLENSALHASAALEEPADVSHSDCVACESALSKSCKESLMSKTAHH